MQSSKSMDNLCTQDSTQDRPPESSDSNDSGVNVTLRSLASGGFEKQFK